MPTNDIPLRSQSLLRRRYLAGGVVLLCLVIGVGFFLAPLTQQQIDDAVVLRALTRQRAYVERIGKLTAFLEVDGAASEREERVEELRTIRSQWLRVQAAFPDGDASLAIPALRGASLRAKSVQLRTASERFDRLLEVTIVAAESHSPVSSEKIAELALVGDAYIAGVEDLVAAYEAEIGARASSFRVATFAITGGAAVLFVLLWFFMIRPAVRVIEHDLIQAKEEAHSRRLAEQETERFKLAVENASEHIVITDADARIIYANPAAERITGYTLSEMIGKKAGGPDLWGGQMDPVFYRDLWKVVKHDKKPFRGDLTNRRKNGETYIAQSSISPIVDRSGEVVYFVALERDITHEKEVDRAKTEFVSLASHQLRTPLSSVKWYAELLEDQGTGTLNEKQRGYLREIISGNQRMIRLVNALLNVSRLELGTFVIEPESIELRGYLEGLHANLQLYLPERGVNIDFIIADEISVIEADPNLLRMIFENVLTNGIKYSNPNGVVTCRLIHQAAGSALDGRLVATESLGVIVEDRGIGIPIVQQKNVFSKLFRAENAKAAVSNGNGLGLYLVKSIVDQIHGSVWFQSVEGRGTTFFIILPFKGLRERTGKNH